MKKVFKGLAIAGLIGATTLGVAGCGNQPPKPYIQLQGFDAAYVQGETINLEGAKVLSYEDLEDNTADEVELTKEMVANFTTEEVGDKKMKVTYNGLEVEVEYTVISRQEVLSSIDAAMENLMTEEYMRITTAISTVAEGVGLYLNDVTNVSDNKMYSASSGLISAETWVEKDDDVWYEYTKSTFGTASKKDITSSIVNDKVLSILFEDSEVSPEDLSSLDDFASVSYDVDGTKTIFTLSATVEGVTEKIIVII